jgi:hypothetical protein
LVFGWLIAALFFVIVAFALPTVLQSLSDVIVVGGNIFLAFALLFLLFRFCLFAFCFLSLFSCSQLVGLLFGLRLDFFLDLSFLYSLHNSERDRNQIGAGVLREVNLVVESVEVFQHFVPKLKHVESLLHAQATQVLLKHHG